MITVRCGHCACVRHAPCGPTCRIESSSVAVEPKIADGPPLVPGRDFTVGKRV